MLATAVSAITVYEYAMFDFLIVEFLQGLSFFKVYLLK